MDKLVAACLVASLVACQSSSPRWSWNGLSLGMPSGEAALIVQRLCGAEKPLEPRSFPHVDTWVIGCDATRADLAGQRVGIDVQFYQDKLLVVSLVPPRDAPKQWWQDLEDSFDARYGAGTNDTSRAAHTREWKTKTEWIRTHEQRSVHFALLEPMMRRSEIAAKQKKAKDGSDASP